MITLPLAEDVLYACRYGSYVFGLEQDDSDIDLRFLTPNVTAFRFYSYKRNNRCDIGIHELDDWIESLKSCGSSFLEPLWVDPADRLYTSPVSDLLVANRELFLSDRIKTSLITYPKRKLEIIRERRAWMQAGPGSREYAVWERSSAYFKQREEKFGYETKLATVAVRLLIHTLEAVRDGTVQIRRTTDKDYLLDLRSGKISYGDFEAKIAELIEQIGATKSVLPPEPDDVAIEKIRKGCWELFGDMPKRHFCLRWEIEKQNGSVRVESSDAPFDMPEYGEELYVRQTKERGPFYR